MLHGKNLISLCVKTLYVKIHYNKISSVKVYICLGWDVKRG